MEVDLTAQGWAPDPLSFLLGVVVALFLLLALGIWLYELPNQTRKLQRRLDAAKAEVDMVIDEAKRRMSETVRR